MEVDSAPMKWPWFCYEEEERIMIERSSFLSSAVMEARDTIATRDHIQSRTRLALTGLRDYGKGFHIRFTHIGVYSQIG